MTAGFSFPLFFCSLYLVSLFSRYNEVCDPGYDFTSPSFSGGTGHFTQVVWKGSTVLGIGRAEGTIRGMKCAYTVARYRPAGNMMGAFAQNVVVGSFDSDSYCASVSSKRRRFFDKYGNTGKVNGTRAPTFKTGPAESRAQQVELLKSKKKTVSHKYNKWVSVKKKSIYIDISDCHDY